MDVNKIYAKMFKQYAKGKDVTVISDFDTIATLTKRLVSLPESRIGFIHFDPEDSWAYLICFCPDGEIMVEDIKTTSNGKPFLTGGDKIYIDEKILRDFQPTDFVDGESEYETV